jgi:hypothetical protein
MNLKAFVVLPEITPLKEIEHLVHELYISKDNLGNEDLFAILVQLGERFSKHYTTLDNSLKDEILELIKRHIDFGSIAIIEITINIMFLFELKNCFDYLTVEIKDRPIKVDIKAEIIEGLKEYKSSFL